VAAPVIYRSSDASAPTLNGNAGSLVAVLNGCLVSGYGSKTALGWGSPFTATNKAVYRAPNGVRHYLDVDDSGPDATALGRNARIRGYETMTAVGTGTGPFPTVAQAATPVVVKSSTADAVARPWLLIGDDKTFYFFCSVALTNPPVLSTHSWNTVSHFGEFQSLLTGDNYRTILGFPSTTTAATTDSTTAVSHSTSIAAATPTRALSPRSYIGTGSAIWAGLIANVAIASGVNTMQGVLPFPNAVDGGVYLNACLVGENGNGASSALTSSFRGRTRGLFQLAHIASAMNDQDTFSGTSDFAGRTFAVLKLGSAAIGIAMETTAWPASS